MKSIIVLLFIVSCNVTKLFGQSPFVTLEYEVNPLTQDQLQWQNSTDSVVWHFGHSYKPFFGGTSEQILVTDTSLMYSANTTASVEITLTRPYSGAYVETYAGYVLTFDHKMDADTIHAGGYIDINIDRDSSHYIKNGDTLSTYWLRYIMKPGDLTDEILGMYWDYQMVTDNGDTIFIEDLLMPWSWYYYHEINGYRDSLFDQTTAFMGTYNDWNYFYTEMFFDMGGIKSADQNDTLIFRLNFKSDSLSAGKNGWALKNIQTGYAIHPMGSLVENDNSPFKVYPNPTTDCIHVQLADMNTIGNYQLCIYSPDGQKFIDVQFDRETIIDLSAISGGIYYYQISLNQSIIQTDRIIKL
jgi:hypothetical protein